MGAYQPPTSYSGSALLPGGRSGMASSPVRSRCIRPLPIPKRSHSTSSTSDRIKYTKVDADTGEEVANEDIVKGYKLDTDDYIEVGKEELEKIALESTRTIDIDEFVKRDEIDPRYLIRPLSQGYGQTGCYPITVLRRQERGHGKRASARRSSELSSSLKSVRSNRTAVWPPCLR